MANEGDLSDLWQSLSYCIIRKPNDLLAHTRRIRLCHEPLLLDRLAGALLDLDYALKGGGAALRNRLHAESLHLLGKDAQLLQAPLTQTVKGRMLPSMSQLLDVKQTGGVNIAS